MIAVDRSRTHDTPRHTGADHRSGQRGRFPRRHSGHSRGADRWRRIPYRRTRRPHRQAEASPTSPCSRYP